MRDYAEETIADIVIENFKTSDVFRNHKIDFCCGGKKLLKDVCTTKNISIEHINEELNVISAIKNESQDFTNWKPDFLVDYIVNVHHDFVKNTTPTIIQYANKVARVHGGNHPELMEIRDTFLEVAEELLTHMEKEEMVLFPYIKKIATESNSQTFNRPSFGTVKNPIRMMESEHETAGILCEKIAQLSSGYQPPIDACNTYRVLFSKLEEYEQDLHKHVHLENNILFPKAIEIENSFLN